MRLTRERLHTSIDRIHHTLLNINTHNLVPHISKLDSQRQPNLPKSNNSDLHEQTLPGNLAGSLPQEILPIVFQEPRMTWDALVLGVLSVSVRGSRGGLWPRPYRCARCARN